MRTKTLSLRLSLLLFLCSCGPKIYKWAQFDTAFARHKIVAILPAEVTTQLRPNEAKKLTAEQIDEMTEEKRVMIYRTKCIAGC